ncbi:MAG: hypothetical protein ABIC68_00600 [Candidatus Omnitrophota bacterium]
MVYKKLVKFFKRIFKKKKKVACKKKRLISKKSVVRRRTKAKPLKRKKPVKKPAKRRSRRAIVKKNKTKKKSVSKGKGPVLAAEVTHYFPKVNAAVLKIKRPLCIGMPILIKGKKTNFQQTIGSMQINRKPIEKAARGKEVGLEVFRAVEPGDGVYEVKG